MRNYILVASALILLISSIACVSLDQNESDTLFREQDINQSNDLTDDEIYNAIMKATQILFSKSKFYDDPALIEEIAAEFVKDLPKTLTKSDLKTVFDNLSDFFEPYRKKTYINVLKDLQLEDIINDKEQLSEVLSKPDVYGITYSSHKNVFDEIEKIYKDALDQVNEMKEKFENLLKQTQNQHPSNDEL